MTNDDIEYAARTYTLEQLEPKAVACIKTGCPSYVHCVFGEPKKDSNGAGYGLPVCAYAALRRKRELVTITPVDVGNLENVLW